MKARQLTILQIYNFTTFTQISNFTTKSNTLDTERKMFSMYWITSTFQLSGWYCLI